MDFELPAHLHATRDLLTRSLVSHPERAPAIPRGLVADLSASLENRRAPSLVTVTRTRSWTSQLRRWFATPAFGAMAAAVLIVGTALPLMDGRSSSSSSETFRGDHGATTAPTTRIIFIGGEASDRAAIESAGLFEAASLLSVESIESAREIDGPKVIVDFTARSITAFDAGGTVASEEAMPDSSSQLGNSIAKAVSRL